MTHVIGLGDLLWLMQNPYISILLLPLSRQLKTSSGVATGSKSQVAPRNLLGRTEFGDPLPALEELVNHALYVLPFRNPSNGKVVFHLLDPQLASDLASTFECRHGAV